MNYEGKGLLVEFPWYKWQDSNLSTQKVLTPDKGFITISREMGWRDIALIGGGMTGSGIGDLKLLESTVNEELTKLQKSPVSA